ncbi:hypothetical protein Ciccas_008474 [Cichlidogyrus casuarinus]|uniref:Protein LTV1 homolog n=1 Tax=Cichlidogyrus casuarinus TaxID=1844966 RepID=A0ABD2Q2H0_9PLAT
MPNKKRPDWKPIRLLPMKEHEPNNSEEMADEEPEHFKYGIYFNDGHDYMQHLRSYEDFMSYKIDLNPTDEDEDAQMESIKRAEIPDSDDEKLPKEVDLPSDDEMWGDEMSEIEDNFVELAGGPRVDENATKAKSKENKVVWNSEGNVEKMLMMEKFLYGSEGGDRLFDDADYMFGDDGTSTIASSIRKGRPLTDREELLEHQFARTMRNTLNSHKDRGALSVVSGSSMLSDQLSSVMNLDTAKWKQLTPKTERLLAPLDEEDRTKLMQVIDEMDEPTPEQMEDQIQKALTNWLGPKRKNRDDITTIACKLLLLLIIKAIALLSEHG